MPHSSIAQFYIVRLQQIDLERMHESNPPDGFLEYRSGLHPPPGGSLHPFGGDITSLILSPFFLPAENTLSQN
ncbi:MAG: hypothetical protein P8P40_03450 [Sulfitobacter sp.]|nr:hypothetical protein [Sulfitobacter sp.]